MGKNISGFFGAEDGTKPGFSTSWVRALTSRFLGWGVVKEDLATTCERKEALLHPFQDLLMLSL